MRWDLNKTLPLKSVLVFLPFNVAHVNWRYAVHISHWEPTFLAMSIFCSISPALQGVLPSSEGLAYHYFLLPLFIQSRPSTASVTTQVLSLSYTDTCTLLACWVVISQNTKTPHRPRNYEYKGKIPGSLIEIHWLLQIFSPAILTSSQSLTQDVVSLCSHCFHHFYLPFCFLCFLTCFRALLPNTSSSSSSISPTAVWRPSFSHFQKWTEQQHSR